jgi:hypothetical protein
MRLRAFPPAAILWVAGVAAWVIAQFCEFIEWPGVDPEPWYRPATVIEETFEMSGSFMWGVALLTMLLAVGVVRQDGRAVALSGGRASDL